METELAFLIFYSLFYFIINLLLEIFSEDILTQELISKQAHSKGEELFQSGEFIHFKRKKKKKKNKFKEERTTAIQSRRRSGRSRRFGLFKE